MNNSHPNALTAQNGFAFLFQTLGFVMNMIELNFLILFIMSLVLGGFILPKISIYLSGKTIILGVMIHFLVLLTPLLVFHSLISASIIAFSLTLIGITIGLYRSDILGQLTLS